MPQKPAERNTMNQYRDFDNYTKEYPSYDGYFGKCGGNYLDNPELIKAFNEFAEGYYTIAQSAQYINELRRIRRDFQGRPTPVYHCQRLSNLLGRGDKDLDFVIEHCGTGEEFLKSRGWEL